MQEPLIMTYEQLWRHKARYNRGGVLVWGPHAQHVFDSDEDREWRLAGRPA